MFGCFQMRKGKTTRGLVAICSCHMYCVWNFVVPRMAGGSEVFSPKETQHVQMEKRKSFNSTVITTHFLCSSDTKAHNPFRLCIPMLSYGSLLSFLDYFIVALMLRDMESFACLVKKTNSRHQERELMILNHLRLGDSDPRLVQPNGDRSSDFPPHVPLSFLDTGENSNSD
jgi:hypothetical protein